MLCAGLAGHILDAGVGTGRNMPLSSQLQGYRLGTSPEMLARAETQTLPCRPAPFEATMLYLTVAVAVLLCLSAMTSGTETAMTGASRARIYHLASEGDRRAAMVKGLLEQQELLGALLLGNNLFNILATALALTF
jgi:hypothetical protein